MNIKKYRQLGLDYNLPVFLGIDDEGNEHFADLVDLKHILMAGSTGSGKSIFGHTLIASLLSLVNPNKLKLLLVDGKCVEFTRVYNNLPCLLTKTLTDPDKVFIQLDLLVNEKNIRLKKILRSKVDNFEEYCQQHPKENTPYIIVIIDSFSDIIIFDSLRFQKLMSQLTDNSAKTGIHLVIYDSRTGPDVFTSIIRDSFPTKICFDVCEATYSKLIINTSGGEKLLGKGDMLLLKEGRQSPIHLQAPFISEKEIKDIVDRSKSLKKNDSIMTCYAFIIHFFSKKYMFHIWTRPYRAMDWHRSSDGRKGRLFWVERYK